MKFMGQRFSGCWNSGAGTGGRKHFGRVGKKDFGRGRKEVRDEVLSRVIVSRLGVISAPIRARIAELAEEEWDVVFDRALSASSVEDLFPARSCVNAKGQPN